MLRTRSRRTSETRSQSKVQGSCQVSGFRVLDCGLCAAATAAAGGPAQAPCQQWQWQPPLPYPCTQCWISRSAPVLKCYIFNQPLRGRLCLFKVCIFDGGFELVPEASMTDVLIMSQRPGGEAPWRALHYASWWVSSPRLGLFQSLLGLTPTISGTHCSLSLRSPGWP